MYTVTTSVRSGIMATDLRAPVDITLPYGAHGASHAATAAAASRRDVRVVSERAQGRSIDPARGSGRKGAASGARRGRLEWIGTSFAFGPGFSNFFSIFGRGGISVIF